MSFAGGRTDIDGFVDPLGDLHTAVDRVGDLDPVGMPDGELATDLLRFARERDRQDAMFAAWVLAAVRRGVGVEDGSVDTVGWLAWKTGLARVEVRTLLRLAEVAELLPETGGAWRDGKITTTAVGMIASARVAGCDDELVAMESEFLDRAKRGDHKSLRILTEHFKACARADGSKPEPPDGFTLAAVGDRRVLRGEFAKGRGRRSPKRFTRSRRHRPRTTGRVSRSARPRGSCACAKSRWDAVSTPKARWPIVSYVTQARTESDTTEPLTLGTFTGVLAPHERDRILCDATIAQIVASSAGTVADVGRATSVWPVAARRLIVTRDRCCQWPGCEMPAPWCDAHHFVHWEHGGRTDAANGLLLCRRHHSFLHAHPNWTFTFQEQRFRVDRPDGTEVHRDPRTGMVWVA